MNTPTLPIAQKHRLQAHFGFRGLPFRKNVHAGRMFDSQSQRELRHGLALWLELRALGLVTGRSGVGKSICLRRFVSELPSQRYVVHRFGQIPTPPLGFLRALARRKGLDGRGRQPPRRYARIAAALLLLLLLLLLHLCKLRCMARSQAGSRPRAEGSARTLAPCGLVGSCGLIDVRVP